MMQLVQITAQYSNAVLLVILPYISEFAHKLDLPLPVPITVEQVFDFKCDPRQGQTGGLVTLTNGHRFTFLDGRVCIYRSPQSYFSLQDPDLIPKFYGPIKVEQKEALRIARDVVKRLGYTSDLFGADADPQITLPEKIGGDYIARYRFKWRDPKARGNFALTLLDIEVDASTGQIQMLSISSPATRRPSPKVDVSPPLLDPTAPSKSQYSGGIQTQVVNPIYAAEFLKAILPQLSDFAAKIELHTDLPLTTNEVDLPQYHCRALEGQPMAQLYLKNGDRLNYQHGHVAGFYAHDAYCKYPDFGRMEDFVGKINISTNDAIKICERVIKNLGYTANLPKPFFSGTAQFGTNEFSRYMFYWGELNHEFASVEIDMETKAIKSIYLEHQSLWRDPPKIDVSMTVETNAPPAVSPK